MLVVEEIPIGVTFLKTIMYLIYMCIITLYNCGVLSSYNKTYGLGQPSSLEENIPCIPKGEGARVGRLKVYGKGRGTRAVPIFCPFKLRKAYLCTQFPGSMNVEENPSSSYKYT